MLTIRFIKQTVADYYNIKVVDLERKTRKREIVQARQIAMYFAKNMTKYSSSKIGNEVGGKVHATVLYACKTIQNLIDTNKNVKSEIQDICLTLYYADKRPTDRQIFLLNLPKEDLVELVTKEEIQIKRLNNYLRVSNWINVNKRHTRKTNIRYKSHS